MKKLALSGIFLPLLLHSSVEAQNLVKNPSFESYTVCPTFNELNKSAGWDQANAGTADFFACLEGPPPMYGTTTSVPGNQWGYQQPRTGACYAGFGTWDVEMARSAGGNYPKQRAIREYVQGTLNTPLVAGKVYAIEFYLSLSNGQYGSSFALDQIGIAFTNTKILQGDDTNLKVPIAAKTPVGTFFSDTLNWMQVTLCYEAVGGEKFFTIGCMADTNQFNSIMLWPPKSGNWGDCRSYYYIDDVSVSVTTNPCIVAVPLSLVNFNASLENNTVELKWKHLNSKLLDHFTVERSTNGKNFSALAKVEAKDEIQNYSFIDKNAANEKAYNMLYYRLAQIDKRGNISYSIILPIDLKKDLWAIRVQPQPFSDKLQLSFQSQEPVAIQAKIVNMLGETVKEFTQECNETISTVEFDTHILGNGLYFLQTKNVLGESKSLKIMKN